MLGTKIRRHDKDIFFRLAQGLEQAIGNRGKFLIARQPFGGIVADEARIGVLPRHIAFGYGGGQRRSGKLVEVVGTDFRIVAAGAVQFQTAFFGIGRSAMLKNG